LPFKAENMELCRKQLLHTAAVKTGSILPWQNPSLLVSPLALCLGQAVGCGLQSQMHWTVLSTLHLLCEGLGNQHVHRARPLNLDPEAKTLKPALTHPGPTRLLNVQVRSVTSPWWSAVTSHPVVLQRKQTVQPPWRFSGSFN
jgi:hypothetical protein